MHSLNLARLGFGFVVAVGASTSAFAAFGDAPPPEGGEEDCDVFLGCEDAAPVPELAVTGEGSLAGPMAIILVAGVLVILDRRRSNAPT